MQRNLATIARSLGTLSKTALLVLRIAKLMFNQAVVGNQAVVSPVAVDKSALTPEMVQQMIISSFSALGLQGKGDLPSSFWLVDSGAFNRMTSSFDTLSNVSTYHGATNIQLANGTQLPIHAIRDINSSVKNVFVSPKLSTSLISVG